MLNKNTDQHHRFGYLLAGFVSLVLLLSATLPALASVGLIYFEAHPGSVAGEVIVSWGTESEAETVGFRVKRGTEPLVQSATTVATVPSQGSSTSGAEYTFTDGGLTPGQTYYYWLFQLSSSGQEFALTQGVPVVAPSGQPPMRRYYLPVMQRSV